MCLLVFFFEGTEVIFLLFHTFRVQIIILQSTKSLWVYSIFQRNRKVAVNKLRFIARFVVYINERRLKKKLWINEYGQRFGWHSIFGTIVASWSVYAMSTGKLLHGFHVKRIVLSVESRSRKLTSLLIAILSGMAQKQRGREKKMSSSFVFPFSWMLLSGFFGWVCNIFHIYT